MYNNKEKGKIIVIDDADSLVGPKAPEIVINILKAALDSTADDEGRLVTYKVTGDLKDEDGIVIPKSTPTVFVTANTTLKNQYIIINITTKYVDKFFICFPPIN